MNEYPDFVKMAEDALGITRIRNCPPDLKSSGSYYDIIRLQQQVPAVAAALGIAYGMGLNKNDSQFKRV